MLCDIAQRPRPKHADPSTATAPPAMQEILTKIFQRIRAKELLPTLVLPATGGVKIGIVREERLVAPDGLPDGWLIVQQSAGKSTYTVEAGSLPADEMRKQIGL